jgi:hypothetical protein
VSGFVCLHRDALDHPLLKDPARLGAWVWLFTRAAWKPTPFDVNGKIITLERGQLCVSLRQLSDEWNWSKSTVERFLTRLKTETMIGTESGTGKMIITICNYAKYQDIPDEGGTASGTASGTRAGHERDTKEQGNKLTSNISVTNVTSVISKNDDAEQIPAKPIIGQSEIDEALNCWNLAAEQGGWKKVQKLPADRRAKLASRLKENGLEAWKQALRQALRGDQLGHDPPTWWSFDFVTKNPTNILKVLEGNYDKRFDSRQAIATPSRQGPEPVSPLVQAILERQSKRAAGQQPIVSSDAHNWP